ncbi:MAG: integration host factor subunit beta [Polyangiaceae bacterium]|nr:integration host factor subunit beta [Polyangiaceae bacterium]
MVTKKHGERGTSEGMTKSELIEAIAARGGLTRARAEAIVNCVFDSMTDAMRKGEGVEIRGFGSFTVRPYKPYAGRNPRTGRPVPVMAKHLPFFKVGKELRELVDKSRSLAPFLDDEDDDSSSDEISRPGIESSEASAKHQSSASGADLNPGSVAPQTESNPSSSGD